MYLRGQFSSLSSFIGGATWVDSLCLNYDGSENSVSISFTNNYATNLLISLIIGGLSDVGRHAILVALEKPSINKITVSGLGWRPDLQNSFYLYPVHLR